MADTNLEQLVLYEHDAGSLDLLVRLAYWSAIGLGAWIYGLVTFICLVIQWFYILILGKRSQGLSDFAKGYLEYIVHRMPYMYIMTDRRPAVLPDAVKIFEETG